MLIGILQLQQQIINSESEKTRNAYAKSILSPDDYKDYRLKKIEHEKELEKYRIEERRHRELCDAIRSRSFLGFRI